MNKLPLAIPSDIFDREHFLCAVKSARQPLPLFKDSIARVTDYFHQQFQQGSDIRQLIWGRAHYIDQLLQCAWQLFDWPDSISLNAVGGYGRGELHPHSDIDLLILINEQAEQDCQQAIGEFVTLLWDMKLNIGHSVRSLQECFEQAEQDITIATSLLESRTLAGPPAMLAKAVSNTEQHSWPSHAFFRAKWREQIKRHSKHGNSEYNLEPNVKSSPGGLRDVQMIGWIAKRHFNAQAMDDLVERGFLLKPELNSLNQGLDFLWRVRYALHMVTGRAEDRLLFDHQRTLAKMFGFEDDDIRLAVEGFMQQYYRWAITLGQLNDLLIQYFDETILRASEDETIIDINPRFRVRNGHIEVTHNQVFAQTPAALMEVFLLIAQSPNIDGLRATTIRLIREYAATIDDDFRSDPQIAEYFMALLRCKEKVALQLRRMLRFGVLEMYLPEFKAIIGQMQHDLFHIYSVDAHTMEVVKNLRRFHYPKFQKRFPVAARIVQRMEQVELLYIAGLYHDIAKGRGGDHSELGVADVTRFAQRHKLSKKDTNLVAWLVQHHLLMSSVAQRKDISSPDVIRDFANVVGSQRRLDYLYALTVADINGTNPSLWNSWRASLLRQLYTETTGALRRGLENPADKHEWIEETQTSAMEKLLGLGFSEEKIHGLWSGVGEEYFLRESVEDIVWHTEAIAQSLNQNAPLILTKESGELDNEGATQIFIHTHDRPSLFALTAAALEQLNLNIMDARIYSSGDGYTLDTFYVLDADNKPIGDNPKRLAAIKQLLQEKIQNPQHYLAKISKRTPRQMRLFSIPTRTRFHNDEDLDFSVLEIITPDRPGLLARVGKIFMEHDVMLQNAKITTLGEKVEDVFFITDYQHKPITDNELAEKIQRAICKELDEQAQI
ncbi:[protein-PII] uridylyltransferase [Dasania sp. GY-MA-18]|uniref:Bifunctional uridylyltransferase/uridylyl-removing enzyme n=1 Tax=Dasania phycosphaerae TaxID=2950436 RepID=A0A9J6RQF8_9GAMM|nr:MULTISPECIES: [protein-PII] uridylyltransferase [Dasania]MCR8923966.1 [protein-PII] uridylyltransferase [Dasania sp. GY-MA-18]MCZ0866400.1 [protein-PII] uridylyltransferase [Dasania phycosphaerae]MCZ0870124.1 [protein-PII] uridylyltransferase [Dasania phycosphaerae]